MLTRLAEGSRRGARTDHAVIALAIEGGGWHGVVSAGMCVLLEKAGLIDAVDLIYGTSSGALNGSFTAAGQAAMGSTNYLDTTANPEFANPLRMLKGRAVINFDFLFEELISRRKPYDPQGLAAGPAFGALGVDLTSSELQLLSSFSTVEELTMAVRASCSLPLFSGAPVSFRGRPIGDGSLIESLPYATASREATHVLVLRSRPVGHRLGQYPRALIELAHRAAPPAVAPLMRDRPDRYNAEAEHLERTGLDDAGLLQITPPLDTPRIGQLEWSRQAIREGLLAGAGAAAAAFGLPAVDILWQPEIYTAAGAADAPVP